MRNRSLLSWWRNSLPFMQPEGSLLCSQPANVSLEPDESKGKVVPVLFLLNRAPRHEGVLGEWRYSSTHSWTRTRWRWVVSFTRRPLYPQGKSPWYPLDRRLGGPQSRSGRGGEEKNSQPLPGVELPIVQPVAQRYTTELSQLLEILIG
jgi:hypothetical protein